MISRLVTRYYDRADIEFIRGLVSTVVIALLLFAIFKTIDYVVPYGSHAGEHYGIIHRFQIFQWFFQGFAFVGAGLVLFFARQWRRMLRETVDLDYNAIEELTDALQNRDAQLTKERSRFKQVVDLQMEFVNKHDPDGTLTFINKALYEVMGFDTWEPLVGKNMYDFLVEDDAARLRAKHIRLTPEEPWFVDMHRARVAGGEYRWVEWQNCGIFDKRGRLHKVLAVGRDMTDRVNMEIKLKEGEAKYRNLFDNMISGFAIHLIVCRLNPDTGLEEPCDYHFLDVNPAFEKMFGFTREEIVDRNVLDIMPNTEPSLITRFGKVADTGKPDRFRCHFVDIEKWFEVTAFSNQPGQFAATFLDVTHRADRRGKRERSTD
jgi:PAS domain S-box-containing protein